MPMPSDLEPLTLFSTLKLSGSEGEDFDNAEAFAEAEEEAIHAAPIPVTSPSKSGNKAWVVTNGRRMGVFETW
jgi:hypothetical protein